MISNGVEIHSAQLSRAGISHQILKNGSSVLVRIISDKGGGKYEGSVAGVRVNISSAHSLKAGDTFPAIINAKDGTIYLNPKDASGNGLLTSVMTMSFSEVQQSELMAFLAASGLPSDSISVSVLQLIKQLGLKIDATLITKIRNLALHFPGKEKQAAELLAILSEKGMDASETEINELLMLLDTNIDEKKDEKQNAAHKKLQKKADKDSLINKINQMQGAWYLLPFELIQISHEVGADTNKIVDNNCIGKGCIRLLFDSAKQLKRLNLEAVYNQYKYLFSLAYEGKKISNAKFNVSDTVSVDEAIIRLKKHFMAAGVNAGELSWSESCDIEGSACLQESFYAFGGEV